jgi:anti-sigma regulatory factor (Ser/Thr protein kinase)
MHYTISFPADIHQVPPLRELASHVARSEGFDEHKAEHIKSVVDEICNNAIEFGSRPGSRVVLELHTTPESMQITCHDQGHGNKLTAIQIQERMRRVVPQHSPRGRGMSLIVKGFMDEVTVTDREGGGITMRTTLHK